MFKFKKINTSSPVLCDSCREWFDNYLYSAFFKKLHIQVCEHCFEEMRVQL